MHLAEYRITIAINGVIYPTRIDEQIRYHINGSYLKEYLQRHHGWSERTWNTIDIAAFGRHFRSLAGNKRVHHMKFIHNIQPIGVNKTKVHGSTDEILSQCPCCKAQEETQFHMLHCTQNPSRAKAIKALRTACRKSDGNRFSQVIGDILEQWLSNPDQTPSLKNRLNPFLRHEVYPKEYIDLINCAISQQEDIGWHDMLRGFLSVKWHQLASSHFSSDEGSEIINRNDGANRVHRILRCIHTFTNDIWKGRNEILHGNEKENETRRLSAIDMEIRKLHDDVESVMTNDRFYCETSPEPPTGRKCCKQTSLASTSQSVEEEESRTTRPTATDHTILYNKGHSNLSNYNANFITKNDSDTRAEHHQATTKNLRNIQA